MRPQDEHQAPAGHPDLIGLIDEEIALQDKSLNLIAAANYLSVSVQKAMDARLSNIHCEGYPGRRYHAGQQQADAIGSLCGAPGRVVTCGPDGLGVATGPTGHDGTAKRGLLIRVIEDVQGGRWTPSDVIPLNAQLA